ncbi:MAG: beta-propeller fold lactonase family protein [Chloroflexota bacterium]
MSRKPKLRYAITSDPFPLQASPAVGNLNHATASVVVFNSTDEPVTLHGLSIKIPIGETSTDLTNAKPVAIAATGWVLHDTKQKTGSIEYIFWPPGSQHRPKAYRVTTAGLTFRLQNVAVNRQPGVAQITITEGSARNMRESPTVELALSKFPNDWGTISFFADTPSIKFEGSAKVEWHGPPATYTLQYDTPDAGVVTIPKPGKPALGRNGVYPAAGQSLKLEQTTTFTLNVSTTIGGHPYKAQKQVTVMVAAPTPTISITSQPLSGTPIAPNTPMKISWTAIGANKLVLTGSDGFSKTITAKADFPQGSTVVHPQKPTTYSLTGYEAGKQAATSPEIRANVQPVKLYYVSASPNPAHPNMPVKVRWSAKNTMAVSLTVNPGSPGVYNNLPPTGELRLYPTQSTTVTLTAHGYQPQSQTVAIAAANHATQLQHPYEWGGDALAVAPNGQKLCLINFRNSNVFTYDIGSQHYSYPIVVGKLPLAGTIAPDSKTLYVANSNSGNLSVIDIENNQLLGNFDVGSSPIALAMAPDGKTVYVVLGGDNEVAVFDTAKRKVTKRIGVGDNPQDIAITSDGDYLLVANFKDSTVSIIKTADSSVQKTLSSEGYLAMSVVVSPDDKTAFVSNRYRPNHLGEIGGTLGLVNVGADFRSSRLNTPKGTAQMAFTADGQAIYVGNTDKDGDSAGLWFCQTPASGSFKIVQTVPNVYGGGMSLAPDGKTLYVANESLFTKITVPEPIPLVQAALYIGPQQLYLFTGTKYTRYYWENGRFSNYSGYPTFTSPEWKGAFAHVDAAFYVSGNVYLFSHNQFVRYGDPDDLQSATKPQPINATTWPGLPFKRITAAFAVSETEIYLFYQNSFCIYDLHNKKLIQDAAEVNESSWPGLPFRRIDAAYSNAQKEVTFFSGPQSIVYNLNARYLVTKWPQPINAYTWPRLPASVGSLKELYLLHGNPNNSMKFVSVPDSELLAQLHGLNVSLDNPRWWANSLARWAGDKHQAVAVPTWEKGGGKRTAYLLYRNKLGIKWLNALDSELKEMFAKGESVDLNDFVTWNVAVMRWARVKHQAIGFPTFEVGTENGKPVRGVSLLSLAKLDELGIRWEETAVSAAELNAAFNQAYKNWAGTIRNLDDPVNWGWGMWCWGQARGGLPIPTWDQVWD